jgi:hypothetical protein
MCISQMTLNYFVAGLADDSILPDLPEETPHPTFEGGEQLGLEDADLANTNSSA